ncbi:hypothetical protein AA0119_g8431 [Alternaria tenuissima]|uniref:Transcription factor domain-containing protein n=1 Tax=Alternaria tenuissima TaxID=119927 RepID=A0A4Q4SGE0_9PLEO|nr:hypothetical protein AA0115_g10620 [Alternaria tenuissima]RYN95661.1 hypothetical protein AA0119_g8431 [Alternaria tenuissima]RYO11168.1 hypothetical protein AA0121_g10157 [Alternaria tenuissima]RYO69049.1 hypothetical protein AA0116_g151 [Alternaria tenuissima]
MGPEYPRETYYGGLLPPLFSGDLGSFQFEGMFGGSTDAELDSFFAEMFRIPSFPRVGSFDPTDLVLGESQPVYQQPYHSDAQILGAYYKHIHPVFPILPPPIEEPRIDSSEEDVSSSGSFLSQTSSPLILALSSVLYQSDALKPPSVVNDGNFVQNLYQRAADLVEPFSLSSPLSQDTVLPSAFHPHVPQRLELPLACCVLSLYQYLRWGNIEEMTRLAQKAHSIIKAMSVNWEHVGAFVEAQRRAWWMSVMCVYNANIVSCTSPVNKIDIRTVNIPHPTTLGKSEMWAQYVSAEETLVASTLLLVALVKGSDSKTEVPAFNQNIRLLDKVITHQLAAISDTPSLIHDVSYRTEERLAISLRAIAKIRLHSARIKLHRYRAFMHHPTILQKFSPTTTTRGHHHRVTNTKHHSNGDIQHDHRSTFSSSSSSGITRSLNPHHETLPTTQIFPFSTHHALITCLDSATTITASLSHLVSLGTCAAPQICSAALASYTLMMIFHFEHQLPQPQSQAQLHPSSQLRSRPRPRLATQMLSPSGVMQGWVQGQCEESARVAIKVLESFAGGFEFISGLRDQIKKAAHATFCSRPS